ncbi:MAG: thiamine pyrophosphate-binding protein [Proteobacteria bacterium]|nr:MAG: thiamine pyrophosphate-binding protein [Pseudomonadota bacterium]
MTTAAAQSATQHAAAATEPVGDVVAHALAEIGVTTVFGVISIHNMPILDAIARQGRIRFVPARGEAGAMNMADAYARVARKLGVVITSTGTAAGNAAGAQVEALTAGSPVLHITSQIDRPWMDRDRAAIHDVPRQADMLEAVSKSCMRVWEGRTAAAMVTAAARAALTAPQGPVSLEIPIDVQREQVSRPAHIALGPILPQAADPAQLDLLADLVRNARRPMLWLGGGARAAGGPALDLAERGMAIVSSANGRAVVPEAHPHTLGAYTMTPPAQAIYDRADLMIVVGSRLRGNETRNNAMRLPRPLVQIDADATQAARNYAVDLFINADARAALQGLCERLPAALETDTQFLASVGEARRQSAEKLATALGPYRAIADALDARVAEGRHPFVRDVTLSNSIFGNRYVRLAAPHLGVHALGGGIGQGIAMAIGAALAGAPARTVALLGDGGAMLQLGELATAVDAGADIVFVLMNDRGYGVIRNIQDAQFGGRRHYSDLHTPDFRLLATAFKLGYQRVARIEEFANALDRALLARGPQLIEVDMVAIGPFAEAFAGPPAGAASS